MTSSEPDLEFELDLSDFDETASEQREAAISGDGSSAPSVSAAERLERLLAPYSEASVDKARGLLSAGHVSHVKSEGQVEWFNVAGSRLYVVKVTTGDDFQFVECSCPNGMHRGGEAICYHSCAAGVMRAGLVDEWIGVTNGDTTQGRRDSA